MPELNIVAKGKRINIVIASSSVPDTFWHSHVMQAAVILLLESTDLEKWDEAEEEVPPNDFLGAILKTVAQSYNTLRVDPYENRSPYEILKEMIEELHKADKL